MLPRNQFSSSQDASLCLILPSFVLQQVKVKGQLVDHATEEKEQLYAEQRLTTSSSALGNSDSLLAPMTIRCASGDGPSPCKRNQSYHAMTAVLDTHLRHCTCGATRWDGQELQP
jgi:hypothetical protein